MKSNFQVRCNSFAVLLVVPTELLANLQSWFV
jgi:hypothetical protein